MAAWRYEISLLVLKKSPLSHLISSVSFLSSRRPTPGCSNVHYPRAQKKKLVFKPVLFASSSHILLAEAAPCSSLIINFVRG